MKKIKHYTSSLFYGCLGLTVIISCFLYWFFSNQYYSQNPLTTDAAEKLVVLKGKLILKVFPGPPEYSSVEDGDREDYCWVLKLDEASFLTTIATPVAEPVNVLDGITNRSHPDEILLVLDEYMESFCQQHQNQEVLSEGHLFHAHTAHHYTPILMDVKHLNTVGTQQQDMKAVSSF